MSEAYTVSKMLASINEVMAPVNVDPNVSVSLKRRMDNGIMLNTSEQEIAYLDLQAKIKHSAQQVAQLKSKDRLMWVQARRQLGNESFRKQQFQSAADYYVEALTGLDFGETPTEQLECQQQLQLPITCNLAACMLMMQQWEKARQMCNQVLRVDSFHLRALQQRAKALVQLHRYDEARDDVEKAITTVNRHNQHHVNVSLLEKLHQQMHTIDTADQRNHQRTLQQRSFHQRMMKKAVGRLYEDKTVVDLDPVAPAASTDEEVLEMPTNPMVLFVVYTLAFFLRLYRSIVATLAKNYRRNKEV